ncbi:hypothetical protein E2320_011743 [Naja naja]|nr:hypothetical protein E2320_011743 [Naja naja]
MVLLCTKPLRKRARLEATMSGTQTTDNDGSRQLKNKPLTPILVNRDQTSFGSIVIFPRITVEDTHFDEKDRSRECDQWKANYSNQKKMENAHVVVYKHLHDTHNSTQEERGDPQEDTDTRG